ncbi:MAG: DUF1553 domain-containing protein [Planctomycetes bacterium]|nr:DUF1553 domain-containing protein [Planctomycetota bacterium]
MPVFCLHAAPAWGAIKILPPAILLSGPGATHRFIVVEETDGKVVRDVTSQAKLSSSRSNIAIDGAGLIRASADGEATITATLGDDAASATVKATGTHKVAAPSFRNEVVPVLTQLGCNSGACHGALAGKGGFKLSLRGYAPDVDHFVLTRQAKSRRVNLVEPARSLLLQKPTLAVSHGGGQKIEVGSPDYQLLADWIAAGAPGPRSDDVRLTRLEVFPAGAVLRPRDTMRMVVRAWYSDGKPRDVTRWSRFSSTEESIVGVDDKGIVTVGSHGEASVPVVFGGQVATALISSPFPQAIPAHVFDVAPRANFIDNLVLKKLQSLNIPPSPACSDHEFIRRAYLDAAGILPSPDEVKKFLADGPDRRARLIERLLERSETVDYWAYKWSDVLLISSRRLNQPAMRAFYQFVRQSVADNKPWDRFAREIITARGSNLVSGAANFFVLHKDVADLTETAAVTFLGMSITCARCHNHPLEKWTQDQYWSMANLFARVALKNGDRAEEIAVQSQPDGEVLHPRRNVAMLPTPLDGKPLELDSLIDRRQYFADWLTADDNPYFAKSLVNRVWRNFLGRGLVEAEDDLRQTNPPSNPELLDALAADFVKNAYNVKRLMRLIMNSAAYQRSSVALPENKADDRFYSRYLIRRLPAEVILDAYATVTGVPTPFTSVNVGSSGGTAGTGDYPLGTRALQLPDTQLVSQFLDAFGRPERGQTCSCERQQDSSVTQALHLANGNTLNDRLRDKKSRIELWLKAKISDREAIEHIYMLALCRTPTATERQRFLSLMAEGGRDSGSSRREVLEDLFWAVLAGRELLFNR